MPAVVIPGIQGHWEWMRAAIDALARSRPVRTFSLDVENGTGDPFEQWMAEIDRAIDSLSGSTSDGRVALVGVSFGGLVAIRYAASRPSRVGAVVLVSAPSPRMTLGRTEQALLRRPVALMPLFAARGLRRLLPEIIASQDTWSDRARFLVTYLWMVLRRPMSPSRTARWVQAWQHANLVDDSAAVKAPVRVITGDARLDRVVPTTSTREYLTLIPGATAVTLERTGHIGLVSRPRAFAALVDEFLNDLDAPRSRRSA